LRFINNVFKKYMRLYFFTSEAALPTFVRNKAVAVLALCV